MCAPRPTIVVEGDGGTGRLVRAELLCPAAPHHGR